jgi:hypothetical protein
MVQLEDVFPFSNQTSLPVGQVTLTSDAQLANVFGFAGTLYFAIPDNPDLRSLGDTTDDRLFKIQNSEDINGKIRTLPLFEPPIDPNLFVQAAAQGLSLGSVLSDLNGPMTNCRVQYLLQKALELTAEVRSFGQVLLAAREKRDTEALSALRAGHELVSQNVLIAMKKLALDEATKNLESLSYQRNGPTNRLQYYRQQVGEDTSRVPAVDQEFQELAIKIDPPVDAGGLKLNSSENEEMDKLNQAQDIIITVGALETLAGVFNALPNTQEYISPLGVGAAIKWGPANLGSSILAIARGLKMGAGILNYQASTAGRKGQGIRAVQGRMLQANAAGYEISAIDKQVTASKIRIAMANKDIELQQKQIDQAQEVDNFFRQKYSNTDLYAWIEGATRTLFYDTYTQAYDLAKKAEKAFKFERPQLVSTSYIQSGYWDATRDGSLSGENLYQALKQLEAAYMEQRNYDYEVTKHASLRQIDPMALVRPRENGVREFILLEILFDMDFPGHYLRRLKSVSVTMPCIVGPYTSVNCTLTLLSHKFRVNASRPNTYPEASDPGSTSDDRFSTTNIPITSIAVTSAQNDAGVFELNFRDNRYMPFEGAGAISTWRLELPQHSSFRQFNYESITDVIIQLRYTSLDGGSQLKVGAMNAVQTHVKYMDYKSSSGGLLAFFDIKNEFVSEWTRLMRTQGAASATEASKMALANLSDKLPLCAAGRTPNQLEASDVWLLSDQPLPGDVVNVSIVGSATKSFALSNLQGGINGLQCYQKLGASFPIGSWSLQMGDAATKIVSTRVWMIIRFIIKQ